MLEGCVIYVWWEMVRIDSTHAFTVLFLFIFWSGNLKLWPFFDLCSCRRSCSSLTLCRHSQNQPLSIRNRYCIFLAYLAHKINILWRKFCLLFLFEMLWLHFNNFRREFSQHIKLMRLVKSLNVPFFEHC